MILSSLESDAYYGVIAVHRVREMIKEVNKTHERLGPMIAMNLLAAKAKKTILNIAPAGCGKSVATDTLSGILYGRHRRYDSLTLAGLHRVQEDFVETDQHIIVDDLGQEKSDWSRTSTIAVLANLVYGHGVHKVTHSYEIKVEDFRGSASMNIQPIMMRSLVAASEWESVIQDKVIRYYHMFRPTNPTTGLPEMDELWGKPLDNVKLTAKGGKLWYQLVVIGQVQWGQSRVIEHIPDLLRALAALDNRKEVKVTDYYLLIRLLKPLQFERYLVDAYAMEGAKVFNFNLHPILVELASFGTPTLEQIAVDYKVSTSTVDRVLTQLKDWVWKKTNSPTRVMPMDYTKEVFDLCGVYDKW